MRLNKLFMGLALGVTLVTGVSGTAEAKAKPVVVTVDKADTSTARKVDAAFKKGKAVTLKVRGSKKASKATLIRLQGVIADTMRYGVMIDLDGSCRDCEGKGNKFHTYKDLDYKQSGSYGCYTFSKSTCNAYKYAFKFIKGNVDRQMKAVKKAYADYKSSCDKYSSNIKAYDTAMMSLFEDIASDNINKATFQFFDDFLVLYVKESTGEVAEGSVDKLITEALSNGADEGVVEEIVSEAKKYNLKKSEPMTAEEFIKEEYGSDTLKFYKGGALEVDFSWADTLAANAVNANWGMKYGGKAGAGEFDASRKMKAGELFYGTDEFRMKSLANDVAHGVCGDFAKVSRALVDYVGYRSYYVANEETNHAICALAYDGLIMVFNNGSPSTLYAPCSTPKDKLKTIMESLNYTGIQTYLVEFGDYYEGLVPYGLDAERAPWDRDLEAVMGNDYPF